MGFEIGSSGSGPTYTLPGVGVIGSSGSRPCSWVGCAIGSSGSLLPHTLLDRPSRFVARSVATTSRWMEHKRRRAVDIKCMGPLKFGVTQLAPRTRQLHRLLVRPLLLLSAGLRPQPPLRPAPGSRRRQCDLRRVSQGSVKMPLRGCPGLAVRCRLCRTRMIETKHFVNYKMTSTQPRRGGHALAVPAREPRQALAGDPPCPTP